MGFDVENQNIIVTGANKGIGLAISRRLDELGAKVSGWDRDTSAMETEGAFAHFAEVDVTDQNSLKTAFDQTVECIGPISGIVANAGINGPTKPLWDYSLEEWNDVINVDLTGVFLTVMTILPHLRERGYGRIVIMSSVASKEGNPGAVPYGAAKAGVVGFAKGLAREILPSNITVNCIAPCMVETELLNGMSAEYIADKKSRIPMGRFCSPEEIADMTAWVLSPRCSFTTGQVFDTTGGRATY